MRIKGFTPVFDTLVTQYDGTATALVYGKIWRYCEWSDLGVCSASNKRLAKELGLGEATVKRAKEVLEVDGYLKITGKVGRTDSITVCHEIVMEITGPGGRVDHSDPGVDRDDLTTEITMSYEDSGDSIKDIAPTGAEILAMQAGVGQVDPLNGWPVDVADKLGVLLHYFPYLVDELEENKANWIKQVNEGWKNRSVKNLHAMCKYVKQQSGWNVFRPSSIDKAWVGMKAKKHNRKSGENKIKEDRFGK